LVCAGEGCAGVEEGAGIGVASAFGLTVRGLTTGVGVGLCARAFEATAASATKSSRQSRARVREGRYF
jgi:hypothetical protein